MQDLKERTIRGGAARLASQVASLVLRTGALVVLARLLDPKDFGLVGMVTAFTGMLSWFRDFGLSAAAVQRVGHHHGSALDPLLDQRPARGAAGARDAGSGAGHRRVLP